LECLPTEELRRVALAKVEGCTNAETALRLGRSVCTVERKLQVIRSLWRDAGVDVP
jgi:DNA-directed RNA polymerase specialized sigma24 family protein